MEAEAGDFLLNMVKKYCSNLKNSLYFLQEGGKAHGGIKENDIYY